MRVKHLWPFARAYRGTVPTSFPGSLFFPFHGTGRREILGTRLGLCITLSDRSKKLPFTSCLLGLRKSNEHCSKVDSDCWRKNRRKTRVTDTHMHGAAGSRSTRYNKRTQNTTRNRIHMSLVPDFLSLGHWATKAKLTNSQKFTVLSKLKNFCTVLPTIKHRLCWAFLPSLVYDYGYGFMSNRKLNHSTFLSHGWQREFNLVSCFLI